MFNYEHSSDQKIRSGSRFEKPNIPFSRNPPQFIRRPFPQLRRRMMTSRHPDVGFRPVGHPVFRPDCPTSHGRAPDFRYPASPNTTMRMAPPVSERLPFPSTTSSNPFEYNNQQYPPLRPALISYPNNQNVEYPERKSLLSDPNSFCDLWVEALAPNGRKYYYNARTRVTAWERPVHVRIIDLNEIKRLQNFSGSEYGQNFPTENQNLFVPQQPFNSYGNSFFPRNFSMPPRLMVLPQPQNVCNPPQIFPVSSTEHLSQDTCYKFNPMIPPQVFSLPMVNGNMLSNNGTIDYTLNVASAEGTNDSLQTFPPAFTANAELIGNENKITDWTVSDSRIPVSMHVNEDKEAICEEKNSAAQEIIRDSDNFRSENDSQILKLEVRPPGEIEYLGEVPSSKTELSTSEQPDMGKNEVNADESRTMSSTHISGTNWYIVSTEDEKIYYFDSLRKISVWEKPIELMDRRGKIEQENMPKEDESNAVQEKSSLESDNCKSENDIQGSKPEESDTNDIECLISEKVEIKQEEQVDKSRPVSSTPVSGTSWFVVWTGDEKVFYFDSQRKLSVWERPNELMNRSDVEMLVQKSPLSQGLKSLKKEVRKIESSGSDTIKKLKKEDGKEETDSSVSMESKNIQLKDQPKLDAIPHEEKVKIFCEMLAEKKVSAFSTWEKELHKIVFDSRYLLLSSKERKQVFESYMSQKIEEEKNERRKELHHQKEKFISLLKEAGVTSKSRFSDVAQRYGKDLRYKAIEKIKQKESLFNQYISELVKSEKELERLKAEKKKKFLELLREHNFNNKEVTWSKVQASISEDVRYKAIQSSSLKEKIFKDYMKGQSSNSISKEREDRVQASIRNREEEVKRDLSVHLKDRERERDLHKQMSAVSDFKALLNDLIRNPDISWHSAKKTLKGDHRWDLAQYLESEVREELFNQHIDLLNCKKREQFHCLLDESPNITLKTSWLDIRKCVLNDQRCSKFSSSERKCEKEFKEYLKEKFLTAKADFKKLLQETKIITHKSKCLLKDTNHLKDIEDILSLDKRYLNLECVRCERREMLMSYIDKLHEGGPPPPPTASDTLNRLKSSI